MPNPSTGSVRVASHCAFERYEEGKIPSIFQMHDKVEVNDIPNMQSGITSQYEINKLTVNGHEIKVGQYLIRVGSALFVVDDPELCGIAIPQWGCEESHAMDAARYAIENPSPVFRNSHRGASVDRIIIDDQVPTRDDAMYDSMVAAARGASFSREEGQVITRSDIQRMVEEWRRQ